MPMVKQIKQQPKTYCIRDRYFVVLKTLLELIKVERLASVIIHYTEYSVNHSKFKNYEHVNNNN